MERLALDRWSSPWLRHQHVVRYRWAARFAEGAYVLDAACGSGYGSSLLLYAGARHVTSLDLSPGAFDEARRVTNDLCLVRADVTRLPLASGEYDLFTCFETVEHVEADDALVREAKRVLEPSGRFLCSTPNRNLLSPGNSLTDRPENPYHVREYAIDEFRELLKRHFASVELWGQTWFSDAHRQRLARAGKRSNRLAIRLHQLRNICGLPWERASRHEPRDLDKPIGVPEVVIAVCQS